MADQKNIDVELENLRKLNKQGYSSRSEIYEKEANKNESSLRNLFFSMAMGVIALASPILFSRVTTLTEISDTTKVLLVVALVLLFISILSGLIDSIITIKFFERWADHESDSDKIWAMYALPTYDEFQEMAKLSQQKGLGSEHTPTWALLLQGTFVILGFTLLLISAILSLLV